MKNNNYTVYAHINKINNKIYIGITKQRPNLRWGKNGNKYKTSRYFWNAINKYGWNNFEHEIIANNLTNDEAKTFEITLISKLNTTNRNMGYNMTKGGDGITGVKLSEEAKKKISERTRGINHPLYGKHHTEESNNKNRIAHLGENSAWFGRKHTDEEKTKIGKGNKGKIISKETRKKLSDSLKGKYIGTNSFNHTSVVCLETGKVYDYIKQATEELKLDPSGISATLRGKQKTCGKLQDGTRLHWMLYSEYEDLEKMKREEKKAKATK